MVTYDKYDIVFQEIPNEVSLAFTIEGCPNNCKHCHSQHLREQNGKELNIEILNNILERYKNKVTNVLFLGGDAFHNEIFLMAIHIRSLGYKASMYSGNDILDYRLVTVLDYYKLGSYNNKLGGLNSRKTNQILYKINNNKVEDITKEFWNENSKR